MEMKNYTTLTRRNAIALDLHCCFCGDADVHFDIWEHDTDTDFPYYTALVDYDKLPGLSDMYDALLVARLDDECLKEIRQETIFYDFHGDTLDDLIYLLHEAYEQYLICLELI